MILRQRGGSASSTLTRYSTTNWARHDTRYGGMGTAQRMHRPFEKAHPLWRCTAARKTPNDRHEDANRISCQSDQRRRQNTVCEGLAQYIKEPQRRGHPVELHDEHLEWVEFRWPKPVNFSWQKFDFAAMMQIQKNLISSEDMAAEVPHQGSPRESTTGGQRNHKYFKFTSLAPGNTTLISQPRNSWREEQYNYKFPERNNNRQAAMDYIAFRAYLHKCMDPAPQQQPKALGA